MTLLALVVALSSALLTACSASSDYMREVAHPQPPTGNPQAATVVFIRPSSFASSLATTILDGRGRFLGDALPSSYFVVQIPPGEHLFISWAENTASLKASLAPGLVYYVEVAPTIGAFSARVHLRAIKPSTENWAELPEWLQESTRYEPDEAAGQAYLQSRQEDVTERIRRGNEILTEYDTEEMAERTLAPGDGLPPGAAPGTAAPPPQTMPPAQPAPAPAPAPTQPAAPAQPAAPPTAAPPAAGPAAPAQPAAPPTAPPPTAAPATPPTTTQPAAPPAAAPAPPPAQ